MKLLINELQKSYKNAKICHTCKEKFEGKQAKDKQYHKVRDHCHYSGDYRGVVHSICNLQCSVPKETPIVSHKLSKYNYQCLGENTKKHITFSVPIEQEVTRIDKKGEEIIKTIS